MRKLLFLPAAVLLLLACSIGSSGGGVNIVPTTGDSASDPQAAQQQIPTIPGYTSTDASSITDAIALAGGSGSLLSGNIPMAAAIAKIDDMIRCYRNVGAVAARVYTDANIGNLVQGQIPRVGALAIVNRQRAIDNFLPCAINTGAGLGAQSATIEPCAGAGSFNRGGVEYDYIYAATDPGLCSEFQARLS